MINKTALLTGVLLLSLTTQATSFAADGNLPFLDKEFTCLTQDQANKYVRDYNINVRSFGGMELCNSEIDTKKLFNDLQLIEQGQFAGDKTNAFIRGFVPKNQYYTWMKSMTRGVNRGNDIPWATAYNRGGYFTMQDGWAKLSTLGRVGTIVHEARHTAGHRHMQCDHGPYSDVNIDGCDSAISQGGSHGVEMEYYSRVILQGQNFHPVYKSMAKLMNLGRANFVFNQYAMSQREGLVTLTRNSVNLVDSNKAKLATFALPQVEGAVLKKTSFGASLFADSAAYGLDLYATEQGDALINDAYSYFKMLNNESSPKFLDIEEYDVGIKRNLVALDASERVFAYSYGSGDWAEPFSVPGARAIVNTAPNGQTGAFVLKADGSLCAIDARNLKCTPLQNTNWPEDVVNYSVYQGQLLELHTNGQVFNAVNKSVFEPLRNVQAEQMVTVPLYDAFEL